MSKMDDRLSEILGISDSGSASIDERLDGLRDEGAREPFQVVKYEEVDSKIVDAGVNEDALEDYKYSRTILYGLIERGTAALEGALMVAKESENPRAYDTASSIMSNIASMTRELIELQKALKPVGANGGGPIKAANVNIQQNNYNGTTPPTPEENMKDILDQLSDDES